jgi:hypothetical protein
VIAFTHRISDVCEACNSGWMNENVEKRARPILEPMIFGAAPTTLSGDDQ